MAKIFISYIYKDDLIANRLKKKLIESDHTVISPFDDLEIGDSYVDLLDKELGKIDIFIPIITSESLHNTNLNYEIGTAIGYFEEEGSPSILPIKIGEVSIDNILAKFRYIELDEEISNDSINNLILTIGKILGRKDSLRVKKIKESSNSLAVKLIADTLLKPSLFMFSIDKIFPLFNLLRKNKNVKTKTIEEKKTDLIKELSDLGIDPELFDKIISNEIDRKMKRKYGSLFLFFTIVFTIASYAIVILDAIFNWSISEIAITALIVETPIQFIGILYVIARNLFPDKSK